MRRRPVLTAVLVLALVLLAGGTWWAWDRSHPSYCEAVEEQQSELSEVAARDDPGAAFDALGPYRELRAAAPADIRDEWRVVVSRLEDLHEALEDAGVDPSDYDPERDRARLEEGQRTRIEEAAQALGDPTTGQAMSGLEQQALDVCGTPLHR